MLKTLKKTFKITGWEVMRNLRNKQFIIGIFLTPVLILLFGGLPTLLDRIDRPEERQVFYLNETEAVLDLDDGPLNELVLQEYQGSREGIQEAASEAGADGYFILDDSFFEEGQLTLYTFEATTASFAGLQALLNDSLQQYRMEEYGLEREVVAEVTAVAQLQVSSLAEDEREMGSRVITAVIFGGGLFFLLITSGSMLLYSALQEKKDKMTEIILSSISAEGMMAGKIIGHFLLGMIQIGVWFGIGLPLADYFFDFPILEAFFNPALPLFIVFALLGYLMFAALFVGIGSTMEDIQSASNSQSMVFMLPVLPVLIIGPVFSNPGGLLATLGSLFPLTAPIIVIVRTALGVIPVWEIAISAVILLVTTVIFTLLAARIFRVGMLMYGKSASFSEVLRWLRH